MELKKKKYIYIYIIFIVKQQKFEERFYDIYL